MREPLENVTLNEILNASYEALKVVMATYMAQLAAGDDAIKARRIFHSLVEEVDDARHDFILMMREQQPEVEAEIEDDDEDYDDRRGWPEEALQG